MLRLGALLASSAVTCRSTESTFGAREPAVTLTFTAATCSPAALRPSCRRHLVPCLPRGSEGNEDWDSHFQESKTHHPHAKEDISSLFYMFLFLKFPAIFPLSILIPLWLYPREQKEVEYSLKRNEKLFMRSKPGTCCLVSMPPPHGLELVSSCRCDKHHRAVKTTHALTYTHEHFILLHLCRSQV